MTENDTATPLPVAYSGELVTRGDLRQDMRDRKTDSWTDVLNDIAHLAQGIAPTDFVPTAMRGKVAAVTGAIMYGREIGMAPMMALQNLHVIEGKPSLSAEGQRALVLQAGHEIVIVESSGAKCVLKGRRKGSDEWSTTTWTFDDARKANLTNKQNWQKYPRQMLLARASAELCRNAFPDVIRGLMASEELEDVVATNPIDVPGDDAPVEADGNTVQRQPRKRAAAKKAAPKPAAKTAADPAPLPEDEEPQTDEAPDSPAAGEAPEIPDASSPDLDADTTSPVAGASVEDADEETRTSAADEDGSGDQANANASASEPSSTDDAVEVIDDDGPIGDGQMKALQAGFTRLQKSWSSWVTKEQRREKRLAAVSMLLGFEVASASDLTHGQAHTVLNVIERSKDWSAFVENVEDAVAEREGTDAGEQPSLDVEGGE